ncbi:MAG: 30S ribosomal protein S12 methylthiotransferase RimO [Rhodospirillaceae bacterium]|nr:30S ribosomal protein S12 methylthiotransferase RimO [Rhodospirillaceae bacterium]
MNDKNSQPQVGIISLGCSKALVDSERILTKLASEGYAISNSYEGADVVIVNTCGFIDSARAESMDTISEAMNENGRVIVTGCLGINEAELRKTHPDILAVTGAHSYEQVVSAVHDALPPVSNPFVDLVPEAGIKLTPRHYAYLKISEGCNHKCRFCIIPSIRGKLVSRPIDEIMREAETLARSGVKELLIISQDTSAYGIDLGDGVKIQELAKRLGELGIWIRMHYVYPYPHVDGLVELMAEGKILPYIDVPFQHASPSVLKAMARPAHQEKSLERIKKWRDICPDLTIRSTFIVGFPGETLKDFEFMLDWLEEAELDRVGCFKYENVKGAPAANLPDHIDQEEIDARWEQFMEVQQDISAKRLTKKIGRSIDVLIDGFDEQNAIGRSSADSPEVDGVVYIEDGAHLSTGDMVSVKITASDEYDLYGELENK